MGKRPNFVLFMTDQHRVDWLGCMGHPVLRTPNIDSLCDGGTRFTNFHVAHPICMPNRAAFLTMRMPSVNGARHNGLPLPLGSNTFVDCLRRDGYKTALIGKAHYQPFSKAPPRVERGTWDKDDASEARFMPPASDYEQEFGGHFEKNPDHAVQYPYYGFDHVDQVSFHGDRTRGDHERWMQQNLPNYMDLVGADNQIDHDYTCPLAVRTKLPEEAYSSFYIRDRAIEWIEENADDEQPFFLMVSFTDPHHPFNPPGKYWDMYSPDDMELPPNFCGMSNGTPFYEDFRSRTGKPGLAREALEAVNETQTKQAMALTAGMIAMIDDAIGDVRGALAKTENVDHTVQIFTTDHGEMLGDHGLLLKGPLNLDAVIRVPFIWNDPEQTGVEVSDTLASTIDIGPSILARAGVDGFNGIQGLDLGPALAGDNAVRDKVLIEHDGHVNNDIVGGGPPRVRTLVTAEWKISVYLDQDWGELFNSTNDPDELQNLWDDPKVADVKQDLLWQLTHELMRTVDRSPRPLYLA